MKGSILSFDKANNKGLISGHDGNRYNFVMMEWKNDISPLKGQTVDFEIEEKSAKEIIILSSGVNDSKSRIGAALFAFFLGGFGAHKFYLGQTGKGLLYLFFFWTLIPGIIAFIEFILFLCMSDEKFNEKYNQ